jgi:hypothetical protein
MIMITIVIVIVIVIVIAIDHMILAGRDAFVGII